MPFPAGSVGLKLRPVESDISTRKILAYAAGLGASDDAFLDDAQSGGLRALPFQCVSPEWPVLLSMRHILGDTLTPDEARRGVHAIQDSIFHRPMRPDDRLITSGQLVSATNIRAGVLTVCRLDTRDRDTQEQVTTTWTSSIYRDVELSGDPTVLMSPVPLSESEVQPLGTEAEAETVYIPKEMPHVYSECANIWNPIHSERAVALAAGLPDVILHGTATWALAGLAVLRRYGRRDVAALKRMSGRFSGMVIPGEDITIRHQQDPLGVVRFEVRTRSGALAISQGVAWLEP
jgi:acyl dehydratase